jgi:hypothetical protein
MSVKDGRTPRKVEISPLSTSRICIKTWDPGFLTIPWDFTVCYRDKFTVHSYEILKDSINARDICIYMMMKG